MNKRWAISLAVAMLAGALVAPGAASASTTQAIADTGGMTIGVVGSPLAVTVSVDEIGHLTEVTVGGVLAEGDEHKVRFSSEDDSTRVAVQAKNHKLTADVKAADLAAILGSHVWAAPLFGSDTDTQVTFEVVENGSGHPELTGVAVTSDADFVVGDVNNEVEDDEAESSVKVTFTSNGYTMTLSIKVSMDFDDDDDDDDPSVKLKIALRGKDVQRLRQQALDTLVGEHAWDGRLCDGTPVGVGYTISEVGAISVDNVTVDGVATDGHEVKTMPHGFVVNFDDSKAKVTVELKEKEDGTWDLKVRSKTTDKCHDHDDDSEDGDDDGDDDEKERGRRDKDKKDKKDKDDDDDDDDEEDDD